MKKIINSTDLKDILTKGLKNDDYEKSLDISFENKRISKENAEQIAKFISKNNYINDLDIKSTDCEISKEVNGLIISKLKSLKNLKALNLKLNLNDAEFSDLSKVIKKDNLWKLDLSHNNITEKSLNNIAKLIVSSPNLAELYVDYNNIKSSDLSILTNPVLDSSLKYISIVNGNEIENLPQEMQYAVVNYQIRNMYHHFVPIKSAIFSLYKLGFKKYNFTKEEEAKIFESHCKKLIDCKVKLLPLNAEHDFSFDKRLKMLKEQYKSEFVISANNDIILSKKDVLVKISKDAKTGQYQEPEVLYAKSDYIYYKGATIKGNIVDNSIKSSLVLKDVSYGDYLNVKMLTSKKANTEPDRERDNYYIEIMQGKYLFKFDSLGFLVQTLKHFTDVKQAIKDISDAQFPFNDVTFSGLINNYAKYTSLVEWEKGSFADIGFTFGKNDESDIIGDSTVEDYEG